MKNDTMRAMGQQLGKIAIVLLGISFFTFMLIMLSPGDPAKLMLVGNEDLIVSQAEIEAVREKFGLDKPVIVQYWNWLCKAITGDLGYSFMSNTPVVERLTHHLPATIYLALASLGIMIIIALPLGVYSAVKQNSVMDYVVRGFSFIGISVPNFWMGLMFLWLFGLKLGWLPIVGARVSMETLIMPAATLGIAMASKFTRQVRATIIEELHQDYVVGARARGMSESHILWQEVLPNALLPLITLVGISLGNLLGGAAVVEMVFAWPGLGRLAIEAITYRDFYLVQGAVLWIALMYLIVNIIVDWSYTRLDPRLRKVGK